MNELLPGLAAFLLVLVSGALFGRLHGTDNSTIKAVGDRVVSGLLALPLICIATHLAFPTLSFWWVIAAPLPLAFYVLLLAGTELGWNISLKHFNAALLIGFGILYGVMAALAWARWHGI